MIQNPALKWKIQSYVGLIALSLSGSKQSEGELVPDLRIYKKRNQLYQSKLVFQIKIQTKYNDSENLSVELENLQNLHFYLNVQYFHLSLCNSPACLLCLSEGFGFCLSIQLVGILLSRKPEQVDFVPSSRGPVRIMQLVM